MLSSALHKRFFLNLYSPEVSRDRPPSKPPCFFFFIGFTFWSTGFSSYLFVISFKILPHQRFCLEPLGLVVQWLTLAPFRTWSVNPRSSGQLLGSPIVGFELDLPNNNFWEDLTKADLSLWVDFGQPGYRTFSLGLSSSWLAVKLNGSSRRGVPIRMITPLGYGDDNCWSLSFSIMNEIILIKVSL